MAYKKVVLDYKGNKFRNVLYDTNREILITEYMTTELAKQLGFTWTDDTEMENEDA